MAIQVGILGMGFMGKCHSDTYAKVKGSQVAALCDVDPVKRTGEVGNGLGQIDVSGKRVCAKAEALIADPALDVIDICLPTYLHARYAVAAMKAGKHVICEKPMAVTSAEARTMVQAAKKTGKMLLMAQCIRFWPSYVKARDIVLSGKYGAVRTARFSRLSPLPGWSWKNWLHDAKKSGLCALDLHIHDADFVQYLFGKPKTVLSQAFFKGRGGIDHIHTRYEYAKGQLITAEGAWEYAPGYPFSMTFDIAMEKATLHMAADTTLTLLPERGKARDIKVPGGDGYEHELREFVRCIRTGTDSTIVTPESAMHSVKLIEAEIESARTGKAVRVRF